MSDITSSYKNKQRADAVSYLFMSCAACAIGFERSVVEKLIFLIPLLLTRMMVRVFDKQIRRDLFIKIEQLSLIPGSSTDVPMRLTKFVKEAKDIDEYIIDIMELICGQLDIERLRLARERNMIREVSMCDDIVKFHSSDGQARGG